jgi:biopolymer transport protein ExbD
MSSRRRQGQPIFTEINITPLTDIFLVLLIIMMVIAPMLDNQGLSLAAPSVQASTSAPKESKAINVHVALEGKLFLDTDEIYASQLKQRFEAMKTSHPDGLIIHVAPQAKHKDLVSVLDAAKASGLKKVAVVRDAT